MCEARCEVGCLPRPERARATTPRPHTYSLVLHWASVLYGTAPTSSLERLMRVRPPRSTGRGLLVQDCKQRRPHKCVADSSRHGSGPAHKKKRKVISEPRPLSTNGLQEWTLGSRPESLPCANRIDASMHRSKTSPKIEGDSELPAGETWRRKRCLVRKHDDADPRKRDAPPRD